MTSLKTLIWICYVLGNHIQEKFKRRCNITNIRSSKNVYYFISFSFCVIAGILFIAVICVYICNIITCVDRISNSYGWNNFKRVKYLLKIYQKLFYTLYKMEKYITSLPNFSDTLLFFFNRNSLFLLRE